MDIGYKIFNSDLKINGRQFKIGEQYNEETTGEECNYSFYTSLRTCILNNDITDNTVIVAINYDKTNAIIVEDSICYTKDIIVEKKLLLKDIVNILLNEMPVLSPNIEKINQDEVNTNSQINAIDFKNIGNNFGIKNIGNTNTGDNNIGDNNIGNNNRGDSNIGVFNKGNKNIGNRNDGNCNNGFDNNGDSNIGYNNNGSLNIGNNNLGITNIGNENIKDGNIGTSNRGLNNIGNCNIGNFNIGDNNIGDCNIGLYNKCDYSYGLFNTKPQQLMFFNKPTDMTLDKFKSTLAYEALQELNVPINKVYTSPGINYQGRYTHKTDKNSDRYLYNERRIRWRSLNDLMKRAIKSMPNFDKDIFLEMTGIDVSKDQLFE